MTKYGYLVGTRYSPPPGIPSPHHPGYTLPRHRLHGQAGPWLQEHVPDLNMAVGLISVAQLTLDGLFSGFHSMTEVYNLVEIRRNNNHFLIPGND